MTLSNQPSQPGHASRQSTLIGANILKRTIHHLCSDQWSEDRADALEIVNEKLEECFAAEIAPSSASN